MAIFSNHNIFRLQISIDNIFFVKVFQSQKNFSSIYSNLSLGKSHFLHQMEAEILPRAVIQPQIDIVGCLEGEMQIYNKWMTQLFQDVQFSNNILDLFVDYKLLLFEAFQSIFYLILRIALVWGKKNPAEGTFSQHFLYFEIWKMDAILFWILWVSAILVAVAWRFSLRILTFLRFLLFFLLCARGAGGLISVAAFLSEKTKERIIISYLLLARSSYFLFLNFVNNHIIIFDKFFNICVILRSIIKCLLVSLHPSAGCHIKAARKDPLIFGCLNREVRLIAFHIPRKIRFCKGFEVDHQSHWNELFWMFGIMSGILKYLYPFFIGVNHQVIQLTLSWGSSDASNLSTVQGNQCMKYSILGSSKMRDRLPLFLLFQ